MGLFRELDLVVKRVEKSLICFEISSVKVVECVDVLRLKS